MLIEDIIQSILEDMHEDRRKSVDGGMDPLVKLVDAMRVSVLRLDDEAIKEHSKR